MTNVTITMPDDLAEIAKEQGLLSTKALDTYVRGNAKVSIDSSEYPPDFPPFLRGIVNPAAFRRGKILGDIITAAKRYPSP